MRRARIKAVANLSNVRRGTNKNSVECEDSSKTDNKDILSVDISTKSSTIDEQIDQNTIERKQPEEPILNKANTTDDVNKKSDLPKELNEKCSVLSIEENQSKVKETVSKNSEPEKDEKCSLAKPRAENEASKFRKPKITPRLNISRVATKVQESDEKSKKNDAIIENPIFNSPERAPESPFSPPFSPTPRTPRSETPREITDLSGMITNHNVHHPSTPQSPFHHPSTPQSPFHHPSTPQSPFHHHPRIRTESLCSIKSTTVANLQPRKKVRTEDQKILDTKRESRERLSNKKIEKSQLRMFDMIYYNPTTNPMKPRAPSNFNKEKSPKKIDLTIDLPTTAPTPPEKESSAVAVPQLKLNANGELVLDEASLVVENEEQKKNRILLANTNVVYHDELSGSYGYYKRQQRTKEWPQEETIKFYRCLNTVGTDFSLMLNLFPSRSRRDLKLKFKKEEKNNPHLVDKALLNHNTFDIEELQRELDEEDEIRRKEAESRTSEVKQLVKRKILKKQEAKAKARQQDKAKIERILSDGDLVLNSVDDPSSQEIKENMEKSGSSAVSKRKRRKKNDIKLEPHMEFKKIVLNSQINSSISVVELKSPTPMEEMSSIVVEKSTVVPKEQPETKPAIIVREFSSTITNESTTLTHLESRNSFDGMKPETSAFVMKIEKELHSPTVIDNILPHLPEESVPMDDGQDTMLSKTGRFISDLITASYCDTHDNDNNNYEIDEKEEEEVVERNNFGCNLMMNEEINQTEMIQEFPTVEVPTQFDDINQQNIEPNQESWKVTADSDSSESQNLESNLTSWEVPTELENSTPQNTEPNLSFMPETSTESQLCKDVAVFRDSSVIFATPSMISSQPSGDSSIKIENSDGNISNEPSHDASVNVVESEVPSVNSDNSYNDVHEDHMEPDTSYIDPSTPLDDESFLNSLDLGRLVIVVKQIDGKDFYDIHETDADSEEPSDKPLNLPRRIVDLIVSAMTQDD